MNPFRFTIAYQRLVNTGLFMNRGIGKEYLNSISKNNKTTLLV